MLRLRSVCRAGVLVRHFTGVSPLVIGNRKQENLANNDPEFSKMMKKQQARREKMETAQFG